MSDLSEFNEFNESKHKDNKKHKDNEKKEHKKPAIDFCFEKDKYLIYAAVFYSCGVALGSSLYKFSASDTLNNILMLNGDTAFINLFLSDLCVYLALFLLIVFLGLCLIGYPVMNIIPAFMGMEYGMKISYYLTNYSVKGVGYALLMIIPFCSVFVTAISYTLRISAEISKSLMSLTKEGSSGGFDIRPYAKEYAIIGTAIIISCLASAGITVLLSKLVTI